MKDFIIKESKIDLTTSIICILLGLILALMPGETLNFITYIIEGVFILVGAITIINFLKVNSKQDILSIGFIQGVACILIAIFLIINPTLLVSILPICIGIWMIIGSLKKLQLIFKLGSVNVKVNFWYIILAILMLTIGIIAVINPFETAIFIVRMLGIGIVSYALLDFFENISILNAMKKI